MWACILAFLKFGIIVILTQILKLGHTLLMYRFQRVYKIENVEIQGGVNLYITSPIL